MSTSSSPRIGLDLGGTKIEARVLADDGSETIEPIRVPTPRDDYAGTVLAIHDLAASAAQAAGAQSLPVGLAIPGAICPVREVVKNANSVWLNGQPLHRDLAEIFGRSIPVENDANCLALSEFRDGAAKDAASAFGVILGTGVGGGIVFDGKVLSGANRIAGEWGHTSIPARAAHDGRSCYCGKTDCVEAHLSGPALQAAYKTASGQEMRATAVAESDDPIAKDVYAAWLAKLTSSMAAVINIVDPEMIVLGGGLSNIAALPAELTERLPAEVFGTSGAALTTQIVCNVHGDSSGARGAAWLAA